MNLCRNHGCRSILTDLYTDSGWIRICPVCKNAEKLPLEYKHPTEADIGAGFAYVKAQKMDYSDAEERFLRSYHASTDADLKAGYLWWAVKCCFGVEYVREVLYENDQERRTCQYTPIFARMPLNAKANADCETLREFERYLQNHPQEGISALFADMRNLYTETVSVLQEEENHYDVFIAWHDQEGSSRCQKFAKELKNWLNEKRVYSFASFSALKGKEIWHFEPYIYAAMATARVFVIVIDDYQALGEKFLKWEIKRMGLRKNQDQKVAILFNGMKGHTGQIPAGLMEGWQRHYEDSEVTPDRVSLVGRDILDALSESTRTQRKSSRTVLAVGSFLLAAVIMSGTVYLIGKPGNPPGMDATPTPGPVYTTQTPMSSSVYTIVTDESKEPTPTPIPTPTSTLVVLESAAAKDYTYDVRIDHIGQKYIAITGYKGPNDADLIIPANIQGLPVREIADSAFAYQTKLTGKLTIPDSVTSIGDNAFNFCIGLTGALTIPDSVTSIGDSAFFYCSGLTGVLTIPNGVTRIGDNAFGFCSGLTGALTIPNGVVSIGDDTFSFCSGLTGALTIPDSVTNIGDRAFKGCNGLTGVLTIPNSVTSIGRSAFMDCSGLTGALTIPDSVMCIGDFALSGCSGLTGTLTIPDSIMRIGRDTFSGCAFSRIENSSKLYALIERPDLNDIYSYEVVMEYTGNLYIAITDYKGKDDAELIIPADIQGLPVREIADSAFAHRSELTGEITIPDSVTSIGDYAFWYCSGLTDTLTIPDGVTSIGRSAFGECSGLTGALTIPDSVTSIGDEAFSGCNFTEVCGKKGSLAESVAKEIGVKFFEYYTFLPNMTEKPTIVPTPTTTTESTSTPSAGSTAEPYSEPIVSLAPISEVSEALFLKAIYECVPSDYSYEVKRANGEIYIVITGYDGPLDADLVIPKQIAGLPVKEIADDAFFFRNDLSGVLTIPDGIVRIGDNAFSNCWNLKGNMILPQSLISIGESAFEECRNLTGNLTIPDGIVQIMDWTFWNCTGLTGKLTIPNGVISIGTDAFAGCSGLTGELIIPDSVIEIGPRAFSRCSRLKGDLLLPEKVTRIDQGAFSSCTGLNGTLTIPKSVEYLDSSAFENCMFLEIHDNSGLFNQNGMRIPEGFSWLDESRLSFEEETTKSELLKISGHRGIISGNVAILAQYGGRAVSEISSWAFYKCSQLTGIVIPEGVARIGSHAFYKCEKLESIILPTTLTWIGDYAFCNCKNLKEITIPKSVEHIGTWAFEHCYKLKKIIGVKGSAAEDLAKEMHVEFQEME